MSKPINKSTWEDSLRERKFNQLENNIEVDVAIIGGGLAGMLTAYTLNKAGKKVALIEKGTIGSGVTSVTTAFLTQSLDTDFTELISGLGMRDAKLLIESHGEAIKYIEKITKDENIDCDFETTSNYIYTNSEKDNTDLKEEADAAEKLGLKVSRKLSQKDGEELGFVNFGYIEIKNQAKFSPIKFLEALTVIVSGNGVEIYEETEAKHIKDPHTIVTEKAEIKAKNIIVTTYEPFNKPVSLYFKKGMYISYVYEVEIPKGTVKEGMYEDTENPYHYMRIDNIGAKDRMIIGGEDKRKQVPLAESKSFEALKEYLDTILPGVEREITKRWSGSILEPIDGRASIGMHNDILYAMAFSGNGMTHSAIAAMMFKDLVDGKGNPWKNLYRPDRTSFSKIFLFKVKDFVVEFFGGAGKNYFK